MKCINAVVVLLLLWPSTGSGAAVSTRDLTNTAVAQAASTATEPSDHAAVVALRQRPFGERAGLVALFGAFAGVGLFVPRSGVRESHPR